MKKEILDVIYRGLKLDQSGAIRAWDVLDTVPRETLQNTLAMVLDYLNSQHDGAETK